MQSKAQRIMCNSDNFLRGDEHGYFAFGGSTVIVLFKHGVIEWDQDMLENSAKKLETLVKMGNRVGIKMRKL